MNSRILIGSITMFFSLMMLSLHSCRKNEFIPPSEGGEVPYEVSTTSTLDAELNKPDYSVYKALWQKANMNDYLENHKTATTTILLLDNNTLQNAGITAINVSGLADTLAKKIIRYHTLGSAVDLIAIRKNPGSGVTAATSLSYPGFNTYLFSLNIAYNKAGYLVNGKAVEMGSQITLNNNSVAIPIKQVLTVPADMWSIISTDPRFSIFIDYLNWRDNRLNNIYEEATGYPADPNFLFIPKFKNSEVPGYVFTVARYNLLIPTNDAFKKIGFNTADDLIAFNRSEPYNDPNYYPLPGDFTVDSLLAYHLLWPTARGYKGDDLLLQRQPVFSYMMNNTFFSSLLDVPEANFDIATIDNEPVKIGIKGSAYPAAGFVEKDINTMNGPLQILDAILVPKDFKLK